MATNHLSHHPSYSWVWSSAPAMADHPRCFNLLEQQEPRRERMFEKPLTPSDVGKLNRLVIPKQHAEKHFPLDADAGEKGLLLTFEDDAGKPWRFRYSYWTSSQSYVLTKGWSRFVKDNRLDAGDVVLFDRLHTSSADRLFIGCRRRRAGGEPAAAAPLPWAPPGAPIPYLYGGSAPASPGEQAEAAAAAAEGSSRRRLRLFGVNLECGPDRPEPMATDYGYN